MSAYPQRGLSLLGLLVGLAIGSFFFTAAFKVGPLYLDNLFVKDALDSLKQEKPAEMTDSEIRSTVGNYFNINNVRDIDVKQIEITREKERVLVDINYEKRIPFLGNLDVVVVFDNRFDSSAPK